MAAKIKSLDVDLFVLDPHLLSEKVRSAIKDKIRRDKKFYDHVVEVNDYYRNYKNPGTETGKYSKKYKPSIIDLELRATQMRKMLKGRSLQGNKLVELSNFFYSLLIRDDEKSYLPYLKEFYKDFSLLISKFNFNELEPSEFELVLTVINKISNLKNAAKAYSDTNKLEMIVVKKEKELLKYHRKKIIKGKNGIKDKLNVLLIELAETEGSKKKAEYKLQNIK